MPNYAHTGVIAALTLARYPLTAVYGALVRMGLDRLHLRRTPGLRFWKLMGTARGLAFGPWEPRRYALFTVWDSAGALETFEARSPVMAAYRRHAEELWTVRLVPSRWHGTWNHVDPFAGAQSPAPDQFGAWAILTRATLRARHLSTFRRAAAPLNTHLERQPGLIASIVMGEVPLLRQATFSLWTGLQDVQGFAYGATDHATIVKRTRAEGWYSEALFARLRPIASYGTWDGADPLKT